MLVPSADPKTVAWLEANLDPVFGFPNVARFSWQPVKNALVKKGAKVKWYVVVQPRCRTLLAPSCRADHYLHFLGTTSPLRFRSTSPASRPGRTGSRSGRTLACTLSAASELVKMLLLRLHVVPPVRLRPVGYVAYAPTRACEGADERIRTAGLAAPLGRRYPRLDLRTPFRRADTDPMTVLPPEKLWSEARSGEISS